MSPVRSPFLRPWRAALLAGLCVLACAQVQAQAVARSSEYLERMDTNGDNRVSLKEYQDWLTYAFDAMDRNRDGRLTADEMPGKGGAPITRAQHRERLAATFKKQDLNHDGYLSAKELSAPPK